MQDNNDFKNEFDVIEFMNNTTQTDESANRARKNKIKRDNVKKAVLSSIAVIIFFALAVTMLIVLLPAKTDVIDNETSSQQSSTTSSKQTTESSENPVSSSDASSDTSSEPEKITYIEKSDTIPEWFVYGDISGGINVKTTLFKELLLLDTSSDEQCTILDLPISKATAIAPFNGNIFKLNIQCEYDDDCIYNYYNVKTDEKFCVMKLLAEKYEINPIYIYVFAYTDTSKIACYDIKLESPENPYYYEYKSVAIDLNTKAIKEIDVGNRDYIQGYLSVETEYVKSENKVVSYIYNILTDEILYILEKNHNQYMYSIYTFANNDIIYFQYSGTVISDHSSTVYYDMVFYSKSLNKALKYKNSYYEITDSYYKIISSDHKITYFHENTFIEYTEEEYLARKEIIYDNRNAYRYIYEDFLFAYEADTNFVTCINMATEETFKIKINDNAAYQFSNLGANQSILFYFDANEFCLYMTTKSSF